VQSTAGSARASSPGRRFLEESPLLRAGLVLAGANQRAPANSDEDDGILTAEEIVSLDLSGAQWAVLSACDTGRGDWQAGEGVLGLRRAFQVAGARTVILSLWPVLDTVTSAWMTELYRGRFVRGTTTAAAVRAANRTLLAARRAHGQSTHPLYWSGFIATGDWR
jgi:CHAT domain-containing protein